MLPHLFSIAGHPVSTYGVFLSLAHLAGIALLLWRARRLGLPVESYIDLVFVILLSGVAGGRAWYVAQFPGEFSSPLEWIYFWKGGLSFFGGLLASFLAFAAFVWRRKLPLWETADLFAPILPFSLGLIRLGCFCAGCCHGEPTTVPWGISFPAGLISTSVAGLPLHPTQLYEAAFLFALSALLFWFPRRFPPGTLATLFVFAYGLYRLLTNPFRGDLWPWIGAWSASDMAAALMCLLAASVFAYRYSRKK
jgi:phosphatidylglycerol:prolipoprotein diacylglycerol transferase